jgi:hypothetical protein
MDSKRRNIFSKVQIRGKQRYNPATSRFQDQFDAARIRKVSFRL